MELQIFNNSEFGQIRTVIVDSEPMFLFGGCMQSVRNYTYYRC